MTHYSIIMYTLIHHSLFISRDITITK